MKASSLIALAVGLLFTSCISASAQEPDQLTTSDLAGGTPKSLVVTPHAHLNGQAHARFGIPSIDSLVNFNDHYFANGVDSNGKRISFTVSQIFPVANVLALLFDSTGTATGVGRGR